MQADCQALRSGLQRHDLQQGFLARGRLMRISIHLAPRRSVPILTEGLVHLPTIHPHGAKASNPLAGTFPLSVRASNSCFYSSMLDQVTSDAPSVGLLKIPGIGSSVELCTPYPLLPRNRHTLGRRLGSLADSGNMNPLYGEG